MNGSLHSVKNNKASKRAAVSLSVSVWDMPSSFGSGNEWPLKKYEPLLDS